MREQPKQNNSQRELFLRMDMRQIEQLIDSISSQVEFMYGRRDSDQYISPISAILRREGFHVIPEYEFRYGNRRGFIDIYARKGGTVICIEIDYKTVKFNSIEKIEQIWNAIPVFVLTYEGYPNIRESLRRIPFQSFYLIDLYNHNYYF